MKSGNILLGLVACAALCACTDNDIIGNGSGGSNVFTGDKAYMIVNISEVGTTTTKGTSGSFANGEGDENAVNDIHFYFYTSDGIYDTESSPEWTNGTSGTDGSNVELTGKKVVVLTGLNNTAYPSYVVTIINQPEGFSAPNTLDGMKEALVSVSSSGTGIKKTIDDTDYFTMSTSSYLDSTEENADGSKHSNTYYFATPLTEDNFTTEPIDEDEEDYDIPSPVEIYVERLAAKVYVTTLISVVGGFGDENNQYRYIGYNLVTGNSDKPKYTFHTSGVSTTKDYNLLYRFQGWALSGTEKQSYMMKHIDTDGIWDDESWSFDWNDVDNCRSYWGKSVHYDDTSVTYPTSGSSVTDDDCLYYVRADDIQPAEGETDDLSFIGNLYCAENTNTINVITSENSSAITNIIVKAQLYIQTSTSKAPEVIPDFVSCGGEFYYVDSYLYTARREILDNYAQIYVKSDNGTYSTITKDYLELTDMGDGKVKVSLKSDYDETTFYGDEEGTVIYTAEDVQSIIDQFNEFFGSDANEYVNGMMYYNIPIVHLNENDGDDIEEAQYGVVRNHFYYVTIMDINNLGRGISNTEEPIIPQTESEKYYIGAEVKVLSWNEVDWDVAI